ncbi:MAG: Peptide chain release factor subunit 1 [Candidatus Fermentimicrarchaeum limneticum]|uniref:Peptide chain release factor subunit 1 n=1 Tax=Fermentimicrarchaeum limneticum TaxID=2795018 RepID=A0A7D5XJ33_FERL1|nr:MAG: Peptide chain release factor subunit 1 [Candidatus Fermentimicrarchaeum limneticum]
MSEKSKARYEMKKKLKELSNIPGSGTELISVYIPPRYPIAEVSNKLKAEYGQASNIKSKSTRKNVLDALEKIINYLKMFREPPENGIAIFGGNISKERGKPDIQLFSISPPEPIHVQFYRCDSSFSLEPLQDMLEAKDVYGLVVMDGREATLAVLKGKQTKIVRKLNSTAHSKLHGKGGQCVDESTLIQLADGRVVKIGELKDEREIFGYNFNDHKPMHEECAGVFERRAEKSYLIKTRNPIFEIKATPEHKFFVVTENGIEEEYAEDIKKGDCLLAVKYLNVEGKNRKLGVEVPSLLELSPAGSVYLRRKRGEVGLSLKDLGRIIGASDTTALRIENGSVLLNPTKIRRIAEAYEVDWEEFSRKFINKIPVVELPEYFNRNICQVFGYMLGDGSLDGNRVILYEGDEQLIRKYKTLVDRTFGLESTIRVVRPGRRRHSWAKKPYFELRVYNKWLSDILQRHFGSLLAPAEKRGIPEVIMTLKKNEIAAFLRGLYDAEGYVREGKIEITMTAEDVIRAAQLLLLRFGIISSCNLKKTYGVKAQYALTVYDSKSLRNFRKHIGFSSSRKNEKLERTAAREKTHTYLNQIPLRGSWIRKLGDELRMLRKDFPTTSNFFHDERNMSYKVFRKRIIPAFRRRIKSIRETHSSNIRTYRRNLRIEVSEVANAIGKSVFPVYEAQRGNGKRYVRERILDFLNDEKERMLEKGERILDILNKMYNSEMILTKVDSKSVQQGGSFYDLTMPKNESFIANCLIVHNSARRYERLIEESIEKYYKRIGEAMDEIFVNIKGLKGIIVGGPGPAKEDFMKLKPFNYQLNILGVVDTGYTEEYGIKELTGKAEPLIAEQEAVKEKLLVDKFMKEVVKDGLATYGEKEVREALESNKVDTLLLSEGLDIKRFATECSSCRKREQGVAEPGMCKCGGKMKVVEEKELSEELAELAEAKGVKVEMISTDTAEGSEFLNGFRGVGALLRYK